MTNTGTARQLSVTLTLAAVGTLAYAGTTAHADPVPTRVAVAETLSAGPSAAPASSAPRPFTTTASMRLPSRLALTTGLGTPTGNVGLEYTRGLSKHFELALGVGVAIHGGHPQGAAMPRARLQGDAVALTVGAGMSVGAFEDPAGLLAFGDIGHGDQTAAESGTIVRPGPVLWSNAELGLELGDQEGVFLRSVLGVGVITADGAENQPRGESRRGFVLPYLGFTIGSTL